MALNRMIWIFAGLFVAFGLMLGASEDPASRNLWGGLSAGCLGGFALALAGDGLSKGRIRFGFDEIDRTTHPRLFFAAVTVVVAAGLSTLAAAITIVFFKSD